MKNLLKKKLVKVLSQRIIITIVILMILALVTINVTSSTGILTKAKAAASSYKKADIKEKAELVKVDLTIDSQTDKNVIVSKQEYMKRLEQEFSGRKEGNKVVVEGDTYDIIIKNTNLDIEVREHSDIIELDELVQLSYEEPLTNIEMESKKIGAIVKLNVKTLMDSDAYKTMKESQEVKPTDEQKKAAVLEELSKVTGQTITDIDQYTVLTLNTMAQDEIGVSHDTIEGWLGEKKLLDALGVESITKNQLNAFVHAGGELESLTNDEFIEIYYEENLAPSYNYVGDYDKNTKNLTLYYIKDEKVLKQESFTEVTTAGLNCAEFLLAENGKYEFILKNSEGKIVAFEAITINNIESSPYSIPEKENDKWEATGGAITKYVGTEKSVTVPVIVGHQYIDQISYGAFKDNLTLENVKILNNISRIGWGAFYECKNLKEIIIPDSVKYLGYSCFYGSGIEKVVLSENITEIEQNTFEGCINLKEVIIKNSVKTIDAHAFNGCTSLKEIVIPDSVTTIYGSVFANCTSLERVTLSSNLEKLSNVMFKNCTSLKEIRIPNSVTSISSGNSYGTFVGCTNLTNIYFETGDNPIPSGQPWGATNENLVITKLTQ